MSPFWPLLIQTVLPLGLCHCWALSNSGPTEQIQSWQYSSIRPLTLALVSSTSWTVCSSEGSEKHHGMDWESIQNFTPSLVRPPPIQVNVICVVQSKTCICPVHYCRAIVCTLYDFSYSISDLISSPKSRCFRSVIHYGSGLWWKCNGAFGRLFILSTMQFQQHHPTFLLDFNCWRNCNFAW